MYRLRIYACCILWAMIFCVVPATAQLLDNNKFCGNNSCADFTGETMLEFCTGGKNKGVGWDTDNSCYTATCGNYNWSAEKGGFPDYDTATTSGGNSWIMECTGDGDATGDPEEELVCLTAGESIKMYSMADAMLAWNETCDGGKVYFPAGTYHNAGCGQSGPTSQTGNSCPVLSRYPTHEQRRVQTFRGIKFVGAGEQREDPAKVGRDPEKTTWVWDGDHGGALGAADEDRDGSGAELTHWAHMVGMYSTPQICVTTTDTYPLTCELDTPGNTAGGRIGHTSYGARVDIQLTPTQAQGAICVDNDLATTGTCASDRTIRCSVNDGTSRSAGSGKSGDCPGTAAAGDGDDCEGYVDAIATDLAAGKNISALITASHCTYGDDGTKCDQGEAPYYTRIVSTGGSCGSDAKVVNFKTYRNRSEVISWPTPYTEYAAGTYQSKIAVVDEGEFLNSGGGYSDMTFMQASWGGRNSDNDLADCDDDGLDDACDTMELVSFGAGMRGGFDRVSVMRGGATGAAFSAIDGLAPAAIDGHMKDSYIAWNHELVADTVMRYENNIWADNDCVSQPCLNLNFHAGSFIKQDTFLRNAGTSIIHLHFGRSGLIRDLRFIGNETYQSLIRSRMSANFNIDGIDGWGNRGGVLTIDPQDGWIAWGLNMRNVKLTSQELIGGNSSAGPRAAVKFTDYNGTSGYTAGDVKGISLSNWQIDTGTSNAAMVFLGGGLGDETENCVDLYDTGGPPETSGDPNGLCDSDGATTHHSAASNGNGRLVDDYRHLLTFDNMELNQFGSATGGCVFVLGNELSTQNDCADAAGYTIWESIGGMPSWRNMKVNAVNFPDSPNSSMLAADVGDCDTLSHGTTVVIHDDITAAGTCDETAGVLTGGGALTSTCACDPAADAWTATP